MPSRIVQSFHAGTETWNVFAEDCPHNGAGAGTANLDAASK